MSADLLAWIKEDWLAAAAFAVACTSLWFSGLRTYWHWRDRRPNMSATLRFGHTMFTTSGTPVSREMLVVDVVNRGATARLSGCYYEVDGASRKFRNEYDTEGQRPLLANGERHRFSCIPGELAVRLRRAGVSGKRKLRAVISDTTGARCRTRKIIFDIDGLATQYEGERRTLAERARNMFEEHARDLSAVSSPHPNTWTRQKP